MASRSYVTGDHGRPPSSPPAIDTSTSRNRSSRGLNRQTLLALQVEQGSPELETADVASKFAVRPDDTVARHQDRHRVAGHGDADTARAVLREANRLR